MHQTERGTERERQLENALNAARLGLWTLDLKTGTLECSPQCRAHFGFSDGESSTNGQIRELQDAVRRAVTDRQDFEAEYPITRADGNRAWIQASGRTLYDSHGAPASVTGITLDITPQKELHAAKQACEESLNFAMTGATAVGAWDWDVVANRVFANARFAQLFSVSPQLAANGAPIADFIQSIHPEDQSAVEAAVAKALETGEEFTEEYRLLQSDGSTRWVCAVGRCHKDESGRPIRFPGVIFDTTERKLAGQRIQESQARLQAIFDGTYEFIGLLTPEGEVLEANRASLESVDIGRQQVIGQPFWECPWFQTTNHAPALVKDWVARAARGEFVRHELEVLHSSGGFLTFDISLHPVQGRGGEIIYIVPEARNITDLKMAESRNAFLVRLDDCTRPLNDAQEIIETAARLLCEHLRVDKCVYGEVKQDGETLSLVGSHLTQFGKTAASAMQANQPFAVSDVQNDSRLVDEQRIYAGTGIRAFCATPLLKDGRLVAAFAVIDRKPRNWREEEVELLHMVGSRCWESLERARITRELRQQRHHFDAILSNSPDLTYTFDLQGRFTYANRALLSLLRLPLAGVLGKNFFDLNYPEYLARQLHDQIQRVIDSKEGIRDQTPFTGPTGETRQYEYIFVPILDQDGSVEAIAGTTRDITERKQAEEQEREREEQLRESARLESLGVMAGGIAHDFNNLLTGILGNACLLADQIQDADGKIARQIVISAERAADLTRQMLAFSGKGRFVIERIDVNAMVRENLTLVHASLSRTTRVDLDLTPDDCVVEADGSQIQQIVMNLLINASEALGELPGTVRVRSAITERVVKLFSPFLQTAVQPGRYVLLEVIDSGCGMSPETLNKIFDPFFTTKFTGRGLGLAAVLGIVKGHQGDIEVVTRQGSGTTFRVLLPLAANGSKPTVAVEEPVIAKAPAKTVLVVDDEEIVRRIAATALSRHGLQVLAASHGEEALQMLRSNSDIALVILDLTMPVMTGEQAIPLIKEIHPEIPIILSSGFNEAELAHRFASAGISGFLQKPYTVSAIVSKVTELLSKAA